MKDTIRKLFRTRGFAFSVASRFLAVIAIVTLLLSSYTQAVYATVTIDQEIAPDKAVSTNTVSLGAETEQQDDVKDIITDSTDSVQNSSLDARITKALETNEAAFVFFYADWCGYCERQKPVLDILEAEFASDIAFIRVNVDENPQAVRQFGVTGYPTMFLITAEDADGGYVNQKFRGYTEAEVLKESFERLVNVESLSADSGTASESTLNSQVSRALESSEAVFLFFYADWCGFCQRQKPVLDILEPEYADSIAFIRVNVDENPKAVQQFGVTGYPTMFLITGVDVDGGYVNEKFKGFTEAEILEESFDRIISGENVSEGCCCDLAGIEEGEEIADSPDVEELLGILNSVQQEYDGTEVLKVEGDDSVKFVTDSVICELDNHSSGAITIATPEQSLMIKPKGIGSWNVNSVELECVEDNKALYRDVYGEGKHLEYDFSDNRITKNVIIDSLESLGELEGEYLEIPFKLVTDDHIYINEEEWTGQSVVTNQEIEIGSLVIERPIAGDAEGNEVSINYELTEEQDKKILSSGYQ